MLQDAQSILTLQMLIPLRQSLIAFLLKSDTLFSQSCYVHKYTTRLYYVSMYVICYVLHRIRTDRQNRE
jgi:hypothetical protein